MAGRAPGWDGTPEALATVIAEFIKQPDVLKIDEVKQKDVFGICELYIYYTYIYIYAIYIV